MTRLKDLAAHCGDPKTDIGIITALQLVRAHARSFAQNREEGQTHITALSYTPEEGGAADSFKTLTLGEEAHNLQYLYLSDCTSLESIVFEPNCTFPYLTHLYLDGCNLTDIKIPAGCGALVQIYAQKQANKLKSLVFEGDCPKLQLLDASDNDLVAFNLPSGFKKLTYLYLNDSAQLAELSISNLPNLNTLSVRNNQLKRLPEHLVFSESLRKLYAAGNAFKNLPAAFSGNSENLYSENCIENARIWFTELRDFPSEPNKIIKLMLTGNGNAGKSSLLCALENGKCVCKPDHGSTHGIQIKIVEKENIKYNVWDFGGQEVYHGTHRLFMASRALQVIVFDPKTEDSAKQGVQVRDRVTKEKVSNHPIEYWYESAREQSPQSAFFIVQNKKDSHPRQDNAIQQYAVEQDKATFIHLSATEGLGVRDLAYFLQNKAEELPDFDMMMPQSWLKVRKFFIDNLEKATDSQKIITVAEFKDLCIKCEVNENTYNLLLTYLHHNGFLYRHDNLGDKIIADQRWALEAIYKPLDREAAHYKEFKEEYDGKIRVRRLFEIFGEGYTLDEKWLFLDFMESCRLCFKFNTKSENADKSLSDVYVFSEFLPNNTPDAVLNYWTRAEKVRVLRFKMTWLNYFTIQSFIAALGKKTKIEYIWRNGIHVVTPEGWFKVALDYEKTAIVLSIEHKAMAKWLLPIMDELKVSNEKGAWEISAGGGDFQIFDLEAWKQSDKIKPEMLHSEMEGAEKSKPFEKLEDKLHNLGRQVILFLAANPTEKKLSFGEEFTHISLVFKEDALRNKFELIPHEGTTSDEMVDAIDKYKPDIIHFVGHGKKVNADTRRGGGLSFHSYDHQGEQTIDADTLSSMFRLIKNEHPQLKIILLNACYSEPQAKALSCHDIYTIGSNDEIGSPAARVFAAGFYRQYALTNDVKKAVVKGLTKAIVQNRNIENLINLFYEGNTILIT
jgi:GTPase SAR1 family protein